MVIHHYHHHAYYPASPSSVSVLWIKLIIVTRSFELGEHFEDMMQKNKRQKNRTHFCWFLSHVSSLQLYYSCISFLMITVAIIYINTWRHDLQTPSATLSERYCRVSISMVQKKMQNKNKMRFYLWRISNCCSCFHHCHIRTISIVVLWSIWHNGLYGLRN